MTDGLVRRAVVILCAGSLLGCATKAPVADEGRDDLARAADELAAGRIDASLERLQRLLELTREVPRLAERRFHTACLLTEAHVRAAVAAPSSSVEARVSRTSHFVAAIYDAAFAPPHLRGSAGSAAREGGSSLPREELATRGVAAAALRLDVHLALAYAGLGFRSHAGELLSPLPELRRWEGAAGFMEAHSIAPELRPALCAAVSDHLSSTDELEAYRFAIAAIEGAERFGARLPPDEVERLETWILTEARARFVCPESGTEYLPGRRRSPVSGVPHMDYVPAPR